MRKYVVATAALFSFAFAAQAQALSWTDFSKTRIKYRIHGYSSPESAQAAAVQSMEALKEGVLPTVHMFQSEDEKCRSVNAPVAKRKISQYIERRGEYSGVRTYGFRLTESFNSSGNPSYGAWVSAQIPCLKKDK